MLKTTYNFRIFTLLFIFCGIISFSSFAQEKKLPFQDEVTTIVKNYKVQPWEKKEVLFTGSSSIRMWRDLEKYFPETGIVNTGFGGSQTNELVMHLDHLVLNFEPSKAFIYEGDNDVNAGKSTEEIIANFSELTSKIFERLPETELFLISAKPSPARWHLKEKYLEFNQTLKKFADTDPRLTYVDVWTPMLNEEGKPQTDLFLEDDLHMNERGYLIWQSVLAPYVYTGISDE